MRINHNKKNPQGFALIATLSLMILLTVIAIGLLSLSSVSLRSTNQSAAQATAQANARMALILAIGELQKHTGPDTRITAPSSIIDSNSPPLLGVWKSWEGTDHETSGRPVIPIYSEKTKSEANGGRFLTWLVSGAENSTDPTNPSALASSSPTPNSVPLLAQGTLGPTQQGQIHLIPQPANNSGTLAWWVSGENQKARLPQPYKPASDNAVGWADFAKSHAVPDPKPFGLDAILTDPTDFNPDNENPKPVAKAITLKTAELIPAAVTTTKPHQFFHDLSVSSVGLLTNTATGGWRKDMSLMTERWSEANFPSSGLPFFRLSPNAADNTSVTKPANTDVAKAKQPGSMLFPWSEYAGGSNPYYATGPVASWTNLAEYATKYKNITDSGGGSYSINFRGNDNRNNTAQAQRIYNNLHTLPHLPIVSRIQWVYSHQTVEVTPPTTPKTYRLQLLATPVFTLWNPYNVSINNISSNAPNKKLYVSFPYTTPIAFRHYDRNGLPYGYNATSNPLGTYRQLTRNANNFFNKYNPFSGTARINYVLESSFSLMPGETKVFSPTTNTPVSLPGGNTAVHINFSEGYRPRSGYVFDVNILNGDSPVKVDLTFDATINGTSLAAATEVGTFYVISETSGTTPHPTNDPTYALYLLSMTPARANQYWPPIPAANLSSPSASSIVNKWTPFFCATFGSRVSSNTNVASKGVVQISPYANNIHNALDARGAKHFVNTPLDFSFFPVADKDSKLPNANNTNHRGYIISGFESGNGLSRVVLNDMPLRPLASLAELQNWDLRSQNQSPPYQINIIGNSDAAPLIPSDNVINPGDSVDRQNRQQDDAYCANHVLFDDWFFSTIAPEPVGFGKVIATDLEARYKQFLSGTKPLVNRNYRPILQDQSLDEVGQTARYNDIISPDGWQRVASRLEVEGMFNVNSTSVAAWRALLGHARNQKIPHFVEGGMNTSAETSYAFSRSTVAGDLQAGEFGMSGEFEDSSHFTGYRVFTEAMLDSFAEKIVEQVRMRGPFLSLSEFVNRRLGESTDERALAGAIQAALNKMAEEPANDPNVVLKNTAKEYATQTLPANNPKLVGSEYVFSKAAEGYSTYGLPGWIRQADVLRPLAPILSARDDTFTIRAYGDARDKVGNILAKAWCEATVRRTHDFVDPADPADSIDPPVAPANQTFGRRYEIMTFRWLSANEV